MRTTLVICCLGLAIPGCHQPMRYAGPLSDAFPQARICIAKDKDLLVWTQGLFILNAAGEPVWMPVEHLRSENNVLHFVTPIGGPGKSLPLPWSITLPERMDGPRIEVLVDQLNDHAPPGVQTLRRLNSKHPLPANLLR